MRSPPLFAGLALVLLTVLNTGTSLATTYKWKDANGDIHYTQSPPPDGVTGEKIKAPPKVDTNSAVQELKDKESGFTKRVEDKNKADADAAKTADKTAQKAKYCADLRTELSGIQSAQRIYTGEGDKRRRLGEDERQARIKSINDKLAKDCK
jgi:hypothetical protein